MRTQGLPLDYHQTAGGGAVGAVEDGSAITVVATDGEWALALIDGGLYYVMNAYIAAGDAQPDPEESPSVDAGALRAAADAVTITMQAASDVLIYGDHITLTAQIPEELAHANIQWQQSVSGGEWQSLPGQNGASMDVVLDENSAATGWRILFTVG